MGVGFLKASRAEFVDVSWCLPGRPAPLCDVTAPGPVLRANQVVIVWIKNHKDLGNGPIQEKEDKGRSGRAEVIPTLVLMWQWCSFSCDAPRWPHLPVQPWWSNQFSEQPNGSGILLAKVMVSE